MIESLRARTIITVMMTIIGIVWITPNFVDLKDKWWPSHDKLNYGLDIQGGLHLVLKVDVEGVLYEKAKRLSTSLKKDLLEKKVIITSSTVDKENNNLITIKTTQPEMVKAEIDEKYGSTLQVIDEKGDELQVRFLDPALIQSKRQIVGQAIEVIRNRIDEFGVSEPNISAQGDDRVLVQLPGIQNAEKAKELINKTAKLEFKMVSEKMDAAKVAGFITEAEKAGGYALGKDGLKYTKYLERINKDLIGKIPKDTVVAFQKNPNAKNLTAGKSPVLLTSDAALTGDKLEDAYVTQDQYGKPQVAFSFNAEGARLFGDLTEKNVKKQMAIVLDNVVKSSPVINERISKSGVISLGSGNYKDTYDEAEFVATTLRTGALPASLEQLEERTVGPTLGADSIRKGKFAGVIAGILVLFFMLAYYKKLGIVANIALTLNIVLLLAILTSLGATLTLPGVAGIVLTLGMAVDANVIIFERMKEELRRGAGIKTVIKDGFGHAFSAIFDANITTAAVCVVLMYFGSGPIRGFAVTLLCGIITSMFTAIFVSRTILEVLVNKYNVKKLV